MSATEDTPGSEATRAPAGGAEQDDTLAPDAGDLALAAAPEVVATDLGEYTRAWGRRIRNGESGVVPIIVGLVIIVIFFQVEQSKFLSSGNLVNLFIQAALYIMFGMAEFFALILSEIDLSLRLPGRYHRVHDRRDDGLSRSTSRGGWRSSAASPSAPAPAPSRAR